MKESVYQALSVWVGGCKPEHRGNNGNCQFQILVRTTSKKRVAEITGSSTHFLREYGGLHVTDRPQHLAIAVEPDVIYYHAEQTKSGWIDKWFKVDKLDKR